MSRAFFRRLRGPGRLRQATELADRVLLAGIDWLEEILLDTQRGGSATIAGGRLTWKSIPSRAKELGIRVHGHFDGEPGLADARAARRAIAYVLRRHEAVNAVVLIRDRDDQAERGQGLEQGSASFSSRTQVVIGLAIPERECWVLSGFEPKDEAERGRLDEEIRHLGFHPCRESHQLTACKDDQAKAAPSGSTRS